VYRLAQNKPIYDIQQKVFGTTNQGQIAKNIIGNTAQLGLTALAGPAAKAGLAAPTLGRQIGLSAAQGGLLGGAMNLANMTAQNQKITPQGVLQGAALGAGLGAATPLSRAMYLQARANPLNEAGFVKLPGGRSQPIVSDPRTSPNLASLVESGSISGDVNMISPKGIQYGGGVKGTALDPARVAYYKNIIKNETQSIDPLVVSLRKNTGQVFLEDGKHRLAAMRALGITDVPVVLERPLRGAALQARLGR
jgi:hypothetical protein